MISSFASNSAATVPGTQSPSLELSPILSEKHEPRSPLASSDL